MSKRWLALAALCAACAFAAPAAAADAAEKIRVILIDGQNNHDWRATTPLLKKELEATGRFRVDVSSHLKPGDKPGAVETVPFPPDLGKYDVLVSNYNGAPWPQEFQKQLEGRLKEGKLGLVIVHAANNSFPGWGEYNAMIGMGWRNNKYGDRLVVDDAGKEKRVPKGAGPGAGHGPQHPFKVTVRDPDHPVTKGMPREWLHAQDELYQGMRGPAKNVHLLATAFSDKKYSGTGEHEPMIWTVEYGKGRVFHTPMGHDLPALRCLGFVATLQRGTEWAATGKVTLPLPEGFPTAEKTSSLPAK
ncbi:MAG TPA: ThuA domain-containing protein [Gemmataceae bacterium]|nr:ThuA domain-containing protein [Gemmataceae bacterium]